MTKNKNECRAKAISIFVLVIAGMFVSIQTVYALCYFMTPRACGQNSQSTGSSADCGNWVQTVTFNTYDTCLGGYTSGSTGCNPAENFTCMQIVEVQYSRPTDTCRNSVITNNIWPAQRDVVNNETCPKPGG